MNDYYKKLLETDFQLSDIIGYIGDTYDLNKSQELYESFTKNKDILFINKKQLFTKALKYGINISQLNDVIIACGYVNERDLYIFLGPAPSDIAEQIEDDYELDSLLDDTFLYRLYAVKKENKEYQLRFEMFWKDNLPDIFTCEESPNEILEVYADIYNIVKYTDLITNDINDHTNYSLLDMIKDFLKPENKKEIEQKINYWFQ